jgi:hypothetical protein
MFKALIRNGIDEVDYNGHFGGESLESILLENNFFSKQAKQNEEKLDEAIVCLIVNAYEEYDKGISLFAGYDENGQQNMLLEAIVNGFSWSLKTISNLVKTKNYFEGEAFVVKFVDKLLPYVEKINFSPKRLYRARIGYGNKYYSISDMKGSSCYTPYRGSEIHAPSPVLARKGRMNRENVAFLYLATDVETALSEVRPHPGHVVSLGCFKAKKELRLADFASVNIIDFYKNDKMLDLYSDIIALNSLFSTPVPPQFQHKYIATQLISDVIRQKNMMGLAF